MKKSVEKVALIFCVYLLTSLLSPARAQQWPARPVTWIVPFAVGGSTDAFARPLAAQIDSQVGQRVVMENRGGAGGTIGASLASKAKPDGYTFFIGAAHHAIASTLYPNLDYNLENDFIPVALIARPPQVVAVNAARLPVKTLSELIAFAKANPNRINYASGGKGTTHHLAAELFMRLTGTKMNHVPYRGNGPAMQDLIAGHVDMMFDNLATSGSQINDGALLGLALAAPERSATLPGVPTAKEAALEKFEVSTWYAIWAPKGTSPEVVERMTQEVGKALQTETIKDVWLKNGSDVPSLTGPNLGAFVSSEVIRWRTVIADAGVKLE